MAVAMQHLQCDQRFAPITAAIATCIITGSMHHVIVRMIDRRFHTAMPLSGVGSGLNTLRQATSLVDDGLV